MDWKMPRISGISQAFSSFLTPRKPVLQQRYPTPHPSDVLERRLNEEPLSPFTKAKEWLEASPEDENSQTLDGDTLLEDHQKIGLKRPAPSGDVEKRPAKKHKTSDAYQPGEDDEESDLEGDTLLASTPGPQTHVQTKSKAHEDRQAMPPPPKPTIRLDDQPYIPARDTIDRNLQNNIVRSRSLSHDSDFSEDEIFTKKTAVRREDRSEVNPQVEYDRALRHAQAQQLPEDWNTWTDAEKDLFSRLAMRGFEPLVPDHWAMDFKTLPLPLFATDGKVPLIMPVDKREFRAKHYLRTLFGIAASVRDKRLGGFRTEPSIKRTLRQFLSWALVDAGVHPTQRPKAIPVHALVTMRRNETTDDVLRRMSRKLCRLARRYQDVHRVQQSIEPPSHFSNQLPTLPNGNEDCDTGSGSGYDDAHMPTLVGLMIASSVVAVVTLDSRSQQPPESPHQPEAAAKSRSSASSTTSNHQETSSSKEEFGLRLIANFDFSTHDGYDVWDGFAMAICVMRIRNTMLELCVKAEREGQAGAGGIWERVWEGTGKEKWLD